MKKLVLLFLMAISGWVAHAATDADVAAERTRIAGERAKAESVFREQEKACYSKFGVTDCLNEAKARRRTLLSDLRRQEVSLNDTERKRRSIDRMRANDERAEQYRQRNSPEDRSKAQEQQLSRQERAGEKAADRAQKSSGDTTRAAQAQDARKRKEAELAQAKVQRERDATENAARHARSEREAGERREALKKRLAEKKKPAASALPVPP